MLKATLRQTPRPVRGRLLGPNRQVISETAARDPARLVAFVGVPGPQGVPGQAGPAGANFDIGALPAAP
jgi:hypothetical protein